MLALGLKLELGLLLADGLTDLDAEADGLRLELGLWLKLTLAEGLLL
jgi:hypothetical protein